MQRKSRDVAENLKIHSWVSYLQNYPHLLILRLTWNQKLIWRNIYVPSEYWRNPLLLAARTYFLSSRCSCFIFFCIKAFSFAKSSCRHKLLFQKLLLKQHNVFWALAILKGAHTEILSPSISKHGRVLLEDSRTAFIFKSC